MFWFHPQHTVSLHLLYHDWFWVGCLVGGGEKVFTSFCLAMRLNGKTPPTNPRVPPNLFKSISVSIFNPCDQDKNGNPTVWAME